MPKREKARTLKEKFQMEEIEKDVMFEQRLEQYTNWVSEHKPKWLTRFIQILVKETAGQLKQHKFDVLQFSIAVLEDLINKEES